MKTRDLSAGQVQHLEMIQGVINRMGQNSFAIKGWAITLLAALFALAGAALTALQCLVAAGVLLAFWWQDAFFLDQERRFRGLYDQVRQAPEKVWQKDPFSMKTNRVGTVLQTAFSNTLRNFYGLLLGVVGLCSWYLHKP